MVERSPYIGIQMRLSCCPVVTSQHVLVFELIILTRLPTIKFNHSKILLFFVLGVNNQPISRMDRLVYIDTVPDNKHGQGDVELFGNRG